MHRRTTMAAIALTATVTVLAGCGSSSSGGNTGNSGKSGGAGGNSSQAPAAELSSAFTKLSGGQTLTTTLKLGGSAAQIKSFASSQGSTIKDSTANAIASASVTIEGQAPSGKSLADAGSGSAANVAVNVGGHQLFALRDVSQVLYIQVDVKDLLNTLGQASTYQEVAGAAASLPPFVQDLLAGKWVSLPLSTLKSLAGSAGVSSSPSASQQNAIIATLQSILTKDVQVSRTSSGGTDTLTLTGNTKTIATDLVQGVSSAVPTLGALGSSGIGNPPDKNVTLTATVTGGALSSLSLDLAQFAKKKTSSSLPVELDFSQSGASISAPSGATPVDTSSLTQLLGAFGGLGG